MLEIPVYTGKLSTLGARFFVKLISRQLPTPHVPTIGHPSDTSNYDKFDEPDLAHWDVNNKNDEETFAFWDDGAW